MGNDHEGGFIVYKLKYLIVVLLLTISCSNGEKTRENSYRITLDFQRYVDDSDGNGTLDDIDVTATISVNGVDTAGLSPSVTLERGSLGSIADNGDGSYSFRITPDQTGEHKVTVSYGETSVTKTPLVISEVHGDWGQPMSVEGLVNTEGYEDGPVITGNGEWLFVQAGPIYSSGITYFYDAANGCGGSLAGCVGTTHEDWIFNTIGPYTAPERPGFYTKRISGDTISHHSEFYGGLDIFSSPTLFYGFKRQSDGSYGEPFRVSIDDNQEALFNPFGLSLRLDSAATATVLFAFNDPTENLGDDGHDIWVAPITLGEETDLITFSTIGGLTRVSTTAEAVNFPSHLGTQGNPHLYSNEDGSVNSIWVDNEYNNDSGQDLFYYELTSGTFPSGTWSSIQQLPVDKLDLPGSKEAMPFFDGTTLYFYRDSGIVTASYLGGAYSASGSWSTTTTIMDGGGPCVTEGCISIVGKPTTATIDGKTYLFFAYAFLRSYDGGAFGDNNMQIGFIQKK